jgi:DNA polymerase III, alpha subunit
MYVELHARSAFSFLEGSSLPEELIGVCQHFGMPAMALLDTDGVYGAPRFHLAANKIGLKAHIGAEVTCAPLSPVIPSGASAKRSETLAESKACPERGRRDPYPQQSVHGLGIPGFARNDNSFRLPLLVASRAGYQNLCRLITKMKLRAKKGEGSVTAQELQEHAEGLICLTGGDEGPLAVTLPQGGIDEARRQVDQLTGIFGPKNVYIELQRHFHREEESRNRAAIDLARSLNLPPRPPTESPTLSPKARELCDAFTAIRNHRTLSTAGRLLSRNSERFLKSPQEMQQLFADLPEAIGNTVELSKRLEFTLNDLGYEFPRYPVPDGENMNSFLRDRAWEGFRHRYGRAAPGMQAKARAQIEKELALIEKLKLPDTSSSSGTWFVTAASKTFSCRDAVRRQQRRLLLAGHHRGRCRRHGIALRALSFRRARRVA